MRAYRILVHDVRDTQPVELIAELAHDRRAHEFARERLSTSPYIRAIEVWRGLVKLCHIRTGGVREAA